MILVALPVDTVAAWHKDDGMRASEHVFPADGTVAFQVAFNASMVVLEVEGHTDVAFVAVEVILAETATDATNAALIAVVNVFLWVRVP